MSVADQSTGLSTLPVRRESIPWAPIVWFAALLILPFAEVLTTMVKEWGTDESMGHGFFVPAVSAYIAWQRRDELKRAEVKPHWFGFVLVVLGFVSLGAGLLGSEFFIMRAGFLLSLYGVLLACCGTAVMRILAFPLLLLPFMLRIPLFIYSQVTFPLQLFASSVAEHALTALNIPVIREGNVLELPSQKLNVVEACSGIRSLLSLTFLSLVYGLFFESRTWVRIVLFLLTIPIAIFANAMRVTMTGILSEVDTSLADGIYHSMEGWVIFVIALAALLASHKAINWASRWSRRSK